MAAGKTILLIEDENIVRVLVRRLLEDGGFVVLEAATLASAREIWRQQWQAVNLLFADVQLPDGSVQELVRDFQRQKPGVQVIFTSGYSQDVVIPVKGEMSCAAFLQKPFNPRELMKVIRAALDETT